MAYPRRWLKPLWPLWLVLTAALALVLILFAPPLLVAPYGISDPDKRLMDENALRTTIAGSLGGLAVLGGALVGALTLAHNRRVLDETQRQNRAMLELQQRGQVTERFTRAIEQMGSDKIDIRIGAIYALEQIARDSNELHWPIFEALAAFVRGHAPVSAESGEREDWPPADVQAVITVIGRRDPSRDPQDRRLYLRAVDLRGVDLRGAALPRAVLRDANLHRAVLSDADLQDADLRHADLSGARLSRAHLDRATLLSANLTGARGRATSLMAALLRDANLEGALLGYANLDRADLRRANLERVWLRGSTMRSAQIGGAKLHGATLIAVDLQGTDMSDVDLNGVIGLTTGQLSEDLNAPQ